MTPRTTQLSHCVLRPAGRHCNIGGPQPLQRRRRPKGQGDARVETLGEIVEWLHTVAFVLIAVWALHRWRSHRDEASRWLAATFGSIGVVVATSEIISRLPALEPAGPVQRLLIAVLVAFPYLLLRFLDAFEPVPAFARRAVGGAVLGLMAAAFVVPLPVPPDTGETSFRVYALAVVVTWMAVLPYVGVCFFLAAGSQPTLARRRLRLLGVATIALSLALLVAGAIESPSAATTLASNLFALAAAGLFLVGFAPPGPLRRLWRHPEEQELHTAAVNLMSARTEQEVAGVLLPHLRRVVGARSVALVRDQEILGTDGIADGELAGIGRDVPRSPSLGAPGDETAAPSLTSELGNGTLHLWLDPYTPFFGEEELDLLDRLGLLADLALDRAALLASETEARTALEHANAELESFVYSASHDLKSPLIAMLGYLDIIRGEHAQELGEDARLYLDRMLANGQYMEELIRDLLELSRVGRVQTDPERVDLGRVAREVATEIRHQHPDATIDVGRLPVLWINGLRARQLLTNLIENAVAHAGDEPVTVTVGSHPVEGGVVVTVLDDGPGIPPAYREQVFGVFERLSTDAHSGTGIGLAICRKIMEACQGRIWVADRDRGAELCMLFPSSVVLAPVGSPQEVPA
jgi:signal transduction histidine kinase